jgi:glycosyltransferase involved in cell wall biosynthesis
MNLKKFKLSILLPSYNEERNIFESFNAVIKAVQKCKIKNFEVIFVDDGSIDKTKSIIKLIKKKNIDKLNIQAFFLKKNIGLGGAFKYGVLKMTGSHLIFVPTDNSHPVVGLVQILKKINPKRKNHILISYVKNKKSRNLIRRLISTSYTKILNMIFRNKIKYFNGLNVYPKNILIQNINTTNSFSFQTEIIIKSIKKKARFYYAPTIISERVSGTTSAFKFINLIRVLKSIMGLIIYFYAK